MHQIGKKTVFLCVALVALLFLGNCTKGSLKPNTPPVVEIMTSGGTAISDTTTIDQTLIDSLDVELYQQLIRWRSYDVDGHVAGYAYRVLNKDMKPILPPPHVAMQESDDPDEAGWIYHYKPGVSQDVTLDSLGNDKRQIWTEDVYSIINFPANDSTAMSHADSVNIPSVFQLKCIDDRGAESEIDTRAFYSYSVRPWIAITSTRGDISGQTTGMGVRFKFIMNDADPYVVSPPNYFEYRLKKIDFDTKELKESTEWYKFKGKNSSSSLLLTADFRECAEDPSQSKPPLVSDFEEGSDNQLTNTVLEVRGYDMAGIVSEAKADTFTVKDGFYPDTILYLKNTFIIGQNHFLPYIDLQSEAIMPFRRTIDGLAVSTPFFKDKDGRFTAINSLGLQAFFYWGYHGEFGLENEADPYTDDPNDKRLNVVLDELTGESYFSSIKSFDIRLDGKADFFAPLKSMIITDDETGKEWLRLPIDDDFSQKFVFSSLTAGKHTFEARAVDDQNIADKTPLEFDFVMVAPVAPEDKEGVLVIDDDSEATVPDEDMQDFYAYCLSKYGKVDFINRAEIEGTTYEKDLHFQKDVLAPSDLEPYKVVLYHSDDYNASNMTNFMKEFDVLNIYLQRGGNLIFSTGTGVAELKNQYFANRWISSHDIFDKYFGLKAYVHALTENVFINNFHTLIVPLGENPPENSYFVGAKSLINGIPSVDLNLEGISTTIGALTRINNASGVVCTFDGADEQLGWIQDYETVMTVKVKDPTDTQQAYLEDRACAIRYTKPIEGGSGTQTCYLFGFPLSSVGYDVENGKEDRDQVKNLLESIIDPIMDQQ